MRHSNTFNKLFQISNNPYSMYSKWQKMKNSLYLPIGEPWLHSAKLKQAWLCSRLHKLSVLRYVKQMFSFWCFWNFCFQFVSFGCFAFGEYRYSALYNSEADSRESITIKTGGVMTPLQRVKTPFNPRVQKHIIFIRFRLKIQKR